MAKKITYPIHSDFAHFPAFPFPFNGTVVSILNRFLHLDTFIKQRKIKAKATKHHFETQDGTHISVYQFDPDNKKADEKLPAVLYFHGGGFVLTYASTHIQSMDYYANAAHCSVFLIDYRLAPKHPFPTPMNDCYESLQWLLQNAKPLSIDESRIAVMGDSAGGALAASIAQKVLDEKITTLAGQVLIYPVLDKSCSTESAKNLIKVPLFDSVANKKMWEVYLSNYTAGTTPQYASPADRDQLHDLTAAYIETAEFDPLCDEGAVYAKRLEQAGVRVELNETKKTIHGFDAVLDSPITQNAFKNRIAFLQSIFEKTV